jgi:predicted ATP-binding protein involved in virulence
MLLKHLDLTQFRAFEQASFDFQPGMNLIVGVNGVGKSSVLDALRILLSRTVPKFTAAKIRALPFEDQDITFGCSTLTAELEFEVEEIILTYLVHQHSQEYAKRVAPLSEDELEKLDRRGRISLRRDQQELHKLSEKNEFIPDERQLPTYLKKAKSQPLAVYFSTRRSLPSMLSPSKQLSSGGQSAAFAEALAPRELRLREFAEWWLVQKTLAEQNNHARAKRYLKALQTAITKFLKTCTSIDAVREPETTLILYKEEVPLDVRQLSDGERGILALVLDLARRLYWANPDLEDPLKDGKAVVLIDEIDLHLHPRWQRLVVDKLTETFQNCQFIATTHSPQTIGEVPPESILILESGEQPYQPEQSLGMDSNWILKYLMDASERDAETKKTLKKITELIEDGDFEDAVDKIDDLRSEVGEFPELVRLQTRIDRIRILGE